MTPFLWTGIRRWAAAALLIGALALPSAAAAKPHWQLLAAPAPGGDDVGVIAGAPAVAYAAPDGVHVARAARNGRSWQPVGGPIRHTAGAQVFDADLAVAPNGQPWVAWTERDAASVRQARVARFDGTAWREVVGGARPINRLPDDGWPGTLFNAYDPDVAFFNGRPYVAYVQDTPSEFTLGTRRLASDGSRWDGVASDFILRPAAPHLVVSGARLYLGVADVLVPSAAVMRFDAPRNRFLRLPDPNAPEFAFYNDVADLDGAPATLFTREDGTVEVWALRPGDRWQRVGSPLTQHGGGRDLEGRYVLWFEQGIVRTAYLRDGAWRSIPVPGNPSATSARLASARGATWLFWRDSGGGWHVARLAGA